MEIYLIRHTTPQIEKGICYGQTDLELASSFKEEIKEIISEINIVKDSIVYTSPLKRCTLLAKEVTPNFYCDNRLKELNFGDWELSSWNDIDKTLLNKWMGDFVNENVPNGESYIDLQNRSISVFNELIEKKYEQLFIITHAGVIRALLAYILEMDLKDSFSIKLNYGDIIKLESTKGKISVKSGLLIDN